MCWGIRLPLRNGPYVLGLALKKHLQVSRISGGLTVKRAICCYKLEMVQELLVESRQDLTNWQGMKKVKIEYSQ